MASYQKLGTIEQSNGNHEEENEVKDKPQNKLLYVGAVVILVMMVFGVKGMSQGKGKHETDATVLSLDYDGDQTKLFDDRGRFVMEDYDAKPSFADFLPGIGGLYGKPVWAFYVNRGQGLTAFGTVSKDYPILEFNAANKAYYLTPYTGFRTFIQGTRGGRDFFVEPFNPVDTRYEGTEVSTKPKRTMYVGTNEMEVKDSNVMTGVETSVEYFVLPNSDFSSLVRRTTITNTGDDEIKLSFLDGLAKLEPDGGKLNGMLKDMGRTLEGWMGVYNVESDLTKPYFRFSTEPSDGAAVKIEKGGHFCLAFIEKEGETSELLPIVYDSNKVFGQSDSPLAVPAGIISKSISEIVAGPQYGDATTSSGFAAVENATLKPGQNLTVAIFYGKVEAIERLDHIVSAITVPDYVPTKLAEARDLTDELLAGVETNSSNPLFNGLMKQTFLDNSLRGGLPLIMGDTNEEMKSLTADEDPRVKVFHAFSRIHGDLERDYNAFEIVDSYFSQGPGNYRDVAQNRRNDIFFVPRMGAHNVLTFLEYIQADGYEPLTVESVAYLFSDRDVVNEIVPKVMTDDQSIKVMTEILLGGAFRPGQLFELVDQLGLKISAEDDVFINTIVGAANQTSMAVYGTGYWADHWDYYLDLINTYLAIYPEGEESLMYDKQLKYFFSTATVKPRSDKYVETYTYDGKSKHILQLDATYFDGSKAEQQEIFVNKKTGRLSIDANWQQDQDEDAVTSSPIAKLFLLGTIKFATRDGYGMGVEYEGGRPGWNDAMNGLVGMVGSGMPETYELYQLLNYVQDVVAKYERPVIVPAELGLLIDTINSALDTLKGSGYTDPEDLPLDVPPELFTYWDSVATAREEYRDQTRYYFSGKTKTYGAKKMVSMLQQWIEQVDLGMARALKIGSKGFEDDGSSGVPPCYFSYDVKDYELNGKYHVDGLPLADPKSLSVGQFPLFLEGPTRMMKTMDSTEKIRSLYNNVKASGLRDEELKMYFISADLTGQSFDMGRMMAFASGWLENHSIWVHMSYKYYLELIRAGLFEEMFSEMKGGGMLPFMDPSVYGRSVMQFSSFLASSAFPDPNTRGRGFSARLSGSTAEFLSIWTLMFIGPNPFTLDDNGELQMKLTPAIPEWLFHGYDESDEGLVSSDEEYVASFKLFAAIEVTYHNSLRTNLYGILPKKYIVTYKDGKTVDVTGPYIPSKVAGDIRRVLTVDSIDAYF